MKKFIAVVAVMFSAVLFSSVSAAATLNVQSYSDPKTCQYLMGFWDKNYIGCLSFTSDSYGSLQETCVNDECGWTIVKPVGVHPIGKAQIGFTYRYVLLTDSANEVNAFAADSEGSSNVVTVTIQSRKSTQIN